MANFHEHKIHELTEENKRLEESLKNSDEMLKAIIKKLEDGIIERYKLNNHWFIIWILTNLLWGLTCIRWVLNDYL